MQRLATPRFSPLPFSALTSVTSRPGWFTRDELIARYQSRSGRDLSTLRYFEVFALFKIAVVEELVAAKELVDELPDVTAVTRDGDLLGAHFASGGSSTAPSLIEVQAAVDEATEQLARATHAVERLTFEAQTLEQQRLDAANRVEVALARLHESDATLAAVAEELAQYGSVARSARGEAERLATQIAAAEAERDAVRHHGHPALAKPPQRLGEVPGAQVLGHDLDPVDARHAFHGVRDLRPPADSRTEQRHGPLLHRRPPAW